MDLHHEMVLALRQKPDDGSDKLLKDKSRTGGSYFVWYNGLDLGPKENPRTLPLTTRSKDVRDLCTDNLFPEIMN